MNTIHSYHWRKQLMWGLLVIGMGLLFLLDNMNIWNFGRALSFWPVAFIVVGVIKLCGTNGSDGVILGGALILICTVRRSWAASPRRPRRRRTTASA